MTARLHREDLDRLLELVERYQLAGPDELSLPSTDAVPLDRGIWLDNQKYWEENIRAASQGYWSDDQVASVASFLNAAEYQRIVFLEFADTLSRGVLNAPGPHSPNADDAGSAFAETVTVVNATTGDLEELSLASYHAANTRDLTSALAHPQWGKDDRIDDDPAALARLSTKQIDLAAVPALRGREGLLPLALNVIRAELFAQTGISSLRPYLDWDDFQNRNDLPDILIEDLKSAYPDGFDKLDAVVGGLAELPIVGDLGTTLTAVIRDELASIEQTNLTAFDLLQDIGLDTVIGSRSLSEILVDATPPLPNGSDRDARDEAEVSTGYRATIVGTDGNDIIFGTDLDDVIFAGAGDDTVYGGGGDDVIEGGEGDDKLHGQSGNDTIHGDDGDDLIEGGEGDDKLHGQSGNDTVYGGDGDDLIEGDEGEDKLYGQSGNDTVYGGDGNDLIEGGEGDDKLYGQAGDDVIEGGAGDDELHGGDGDDTLDGGDGADVMVGGAGNDTMVVDDPNDVVIEAPDEGEDTVETSLDTYVLPVNIENLIAIGNHLSFDGTGNELDNQIFGQVEGDNALRGRDGNDRLYGGKGDDHLYGGRGDDRLYGNEGDDHLFGGSGDDRLEGNEGNDVLIGGRGDDEVKGGTGDDRIYGGSGDDRLEGDEGNDHIFGGDGNDRIDGGDGNDFIIGGNGNDRIDGGNGDDTIFGDDGDDVIHGGDGHDYIDGGDGHNIVNGGAGNDTMRGSWRAYDPNIAVASIGDTDLFVASFRSDTFVLEMGFGQDVILDFSADDNGRGGRDRVDVSAYLTFTSESVGTEILISSIGTSTLIKIGDDTLTLVGIDAATIGADTFIFR